jgi:hypothetical protein
MSLSDARIRQYQIWISDWENRLGYCYHCDYEYTDVEKLLIKDISYCPKCLNEERKTYYYCEEHGSSDDDCRR